MLLTKVMNSEEKHPPMGETWEGHMKKPRWWTNLDERTRWRIADTLLFLAVFFLGWAAAMSSVIMHFTS
jgi:hypothetical protein